MDLVSSNLILFLICPLDLLKSFSFYIFLIIPCKNDKHNVILARRRQCLRSCSDILWRRESENHTGSIPSTGFLHAIDVSHGISDKCYSVLNIRFATQICSRNQEKQQSRLVLQIRRKHRRRLSCWNRHGLDGSMSRNHARTTSLRYQWRMATNILRHPRRDSIYLLEKEQHIIRTIQTTTTNNNKIHHESTTPRNPHPNASNLPLPPNNNNNLHSHHPPRSPPNNTLRTAILTLAPHYNRRSSHRRRTNPLSTPNRQSDRRKRHL